MIDAQIIKLLDKRFGVSKAIGKLKRKNGDRIVQPKREKEILAKIRKRSKNKNAIVKIFKIVMRESKRLQKSR